MYCRVINPLPTNSWQRQRFSLHHSIDASFGSHSASCPVDADVKNVWSYTTIPLFFFMELSIN
jgi:hypothetical protein